MRYLLSLLLLVGAADALDFGKLQIEKGYAGPVVVDVDWSAGSPRDVTGATGTLTVYSTPPAGAVAGTPLFSCSLLPVGTPTNRMSCTLTDVQTTPPGTYYAVVTIVEGQNKDPIHGTIEVSGR